MRWTRLVASGVALAAGLAASITMGVAPSASGATAGPSVIEPSACTVSGPLTSFVNPADTDTDSLFDPFVHFTATDGHGSLAGTAWTEGPSHGGLRQLAVVRRDASGAFRVLGRFTYDSIGFSFHQSVRVIGFDPWGGVVVKVQRTNIDTRYIGIRYDRAGVRHDLQLSPAWLSAEPVGMADSGSVLGSVVRTDGKRQVVIWRGAGGGAVSVLSSPDVYAVGITADADWLGQTRWTGRTQVHVHGGGPTLPLTDWEGRPDGNSPSLQLVVGGSAYGSITSNAAARWTVGAATGGVVRPQPIGYLTSVTAAGRSRDAVGTYPTTSSTPWGAPRVLVTVTGKAYRMPPGFAPVEGEEPLAELVDQYGRVVYTGSDRLPHLLTCPR